jgi:O-methyltransferase involved in polyketide biosynthesis
MTDTPHTVDDLLDLWDDHTAPCESMLRHPSQPLTLRIPGSAWQAIEQPDGRWTYTANGEVIWADMTGSRYDAWLLLLDVHRDPSPRAESQGRPVPDSDPLAPARGIVCATAAMACVYAGVFAVLRWRGVL